jgi:hypothetical protein
MGMPEITEAAHAVAEGPREAWPFRAMAFGDQLDSALADPARLIDVSTRLVAVAEGHRCQAVIGASALGNRLASATVAIANNGLRIFDREAPTERVLIVDGSLATGTQVAKAARFARGAGARFTPAAVVVSLAGPGTQVADEAIDELVVLFD